MQQTILAAGGRSVSDPAQLCSHRDTIDEYEAQVSVVEADANYIEARLDEARAHREDLLKTIAIHRSYLAPVAKMPVEILSMIFLEFVETSPIYERHRLALVRRHWRDVLNGTPLLWRRIHLSREKRMPTKSAVRRHITQAGMIPLELTVDVTALADADGDLIWIYKSEVMEWYNIVKNHAWRSFRLICDTFADYLDDDLAPFLYAGLSGQTVAGLEDLRLEIADGNEEPWLDEVLLEAPALKTLHLPHHFTMEPNHPVLK